MSLCPNCGAEQAEDAVFCSKCGKKLNSNTTDAKQVATEEADKGEGSSTEAIKEEDTSKESASSSSTASDAIGDDGQTATSGGSPQASTSDDNPQASTSDDNPQEEATSGDSLQASASDDSLQEGTASGGSPQEAQAGSPSRRRRVGIIVGIIVAVVVVIAIIVAVVLSGNNAFADQVKQDVEAHYRDNGVVSSNYVEESRYELTDFELNGQEESTETIAGYEVQVRDVDFSGTIKNDSFETTLTGRVYYTKDNDSWTAEDATFETTSSTTTPLKGVDSFEATPSDSSSGADQYENYSEDEEGFESTAPAQSDDGRYTTEASAEIEYDFWYATDTAKKTLKFTLDPDSADGWKPDGEADLSDVSTSWEPLVDKTFYLEIPGYGLHGQIAPESSLVFVDGGEESTIAAHYSILYEPAESDSSNGNIYTKVELEGDLRNDEANDASVKHDFGKDDFSFELQDSINDVTFDCSETSDEILEGDLKKHRMSVSLTTGREYYRFELNGHAQSPYTLDLKNAIYAEDQSS